MLRAFSTTLSKQEFPRVCVLLSGCGVFDGSEVAETVCALVSLQRKKASVRCFAPDVDQFHVVNHLTGEESREKRSCLAEAARITRGDMTPLCDLDASEFDAILIPGGFGAAKNLSTFAFDGLDMTVNEEVEAVLKEFHSNKKPIGMMCIAPVIASKVFDDITITLGHEEEEDGAWPFAGATGASRMMGATHVQKEVSETVVDEKNKLVTSPAFMCGTASFADVFDSTEALVEDLLKLIN